MSGDKRSLPDITMEVDREPVQGTEDVLGAGEEDEHHYTDDEDLDKDIDITPELRAAENDGVKHGEQVDNNVGISDGDGLGVNNGVENGNINNLVDRVDENTIALVHFSDTLAENILKEAVLISDIYAKDAVNVNKDVLRDTCNPVTDRISLNVVNRNIGRRLPPGGTENGCDKYLLEKLLHSQPDMEDDTDLYGGFTGQEATLEPEGIDCNKGLLEVSDKNNNQMDAGTISMLSDNYLETIHEDRELVIDPPDEHDGLDDEAGKESYHSAEQPAVPQLEADPEQEKFDAAIQKVENEAEPMESLRPYYSESSEDESEDELDCCEMTHKEKRAVVRAVRHGDIDVVEVLLEKRRADMDMIWYGENLLMIAIRGDQESMAEFLIDNDIDLSYSTKLLERTEGGNVTLFEVTARQMAFDKGMDDIVELIDFKTNNLFPFVKPKEREVRMRRPRPPTPSPEPEELDDEEEIFYDPETDTCLLRDPNEHVSETNSENRYAGSHHGSRHSQDSRHKTTYRGGAPTRTSGTSKLDESVLTMPSESKRSESGYEIHDDISHVFGQDEGYETMSPVSPMAMAPVHRLERNFIGTKDHVSVRGTRASYSIKSQNSASRSRSRSDSDSVQDYVVSPIQSVGSYNRERRRWNQTKSAPVSRNMSVESLPDAVVRVGFPFVHGSQKDRTKSASSATSSSSKSSKSDSTPRQQRSQSARSHLSPFSEVARLLSQSKLLSPSANSSSALTHLPEIKTEPLVKRKDTRTSYTCIYANSTSSIPGRTIYACRNSSSRYSELHTKKNVRA